MSSENDFVFVSVDCEADQYAAMLTIESQLQETFVVGSREVVIPEAVDRDRSIVGEDLIVIHPEVLTFALTRCYMSCVILGPDFFEGINQELSVVASVEQSKLQISRFEFSLNDHGLGLYFFSFFWLGFLHL